VSGRSERQRRQEARQGPARTGWHRLLALPMVIPLAIALVGAAAVWALLSRATVPVTTPPTPAASPTRTPAELASVDTSATGAPVDGIECSAHEGSLFHIHAHLAVFVDGTAAIIPAGIGIAPPRDVQKTSTVTYVAGGRCFYWVHSHTADGIVHIESPVQRSFTLGDYFDIWQQPLSATAVGPAKGTVTAYVDGGVFSGDPRSIAVTAHSVIQLDVGTVVPPQPFTFTGGL
jgi:hypothetical protein